MKKLKLYLDTSVLNFIFAEDAPDFKNVTIDFFENYVAKEKYDVFISSVVIREIEKHRIHSREICFLIQSKSIPFVF